MSIKDYDFGKELGKGAFGTVCLVVRKEDKKTFAMKRVKIAQLSMKERENALNEIRILASLSHKNIIGYEEAFFDEDTKTLNIVMEFADDGDIESKIKQTTKSRSIFQETTIWNWLIQTLEGLKYLHDNKIMHRDLKCANIFMMKNGQLKLGDLNVSKIVKMGMAQTQTGTPYYASPEIWKDRPYDYKSDIWSVGCIIYEMCTLRPPFRGTSLKNLSDNINRGVYDPIPPMYSRDLAKVISLMLVVEPSKRLSTDQLLGHELIVKRITEEKTLTNIETKSAKVNLIQTIKLPRNMREINNALPKKKIKNREKMMENDAFETGKGFGKDVKEKEDKNYIAPKKEINLGGDMGGVGVGGQSNNNPNQNLNQNYPMQQNYHNQNYQPFQNNNFISNNPSGEDVLNDYYKKQKEREQEREKEKEKERERLRERQKEIEKEKEKEREREREKRKEEQNKYIPSNINNNNIYNREENLNNCIKPVYLNQQQQSNDYLQNIKRAQYMQNNINSSNNNNYHYNKNDPYPKGPSLGSNDKAQDHQQPLMKKPSFEDKNKHIDCKKKPTINSPENQRPISSKHPNIVGKKPNNLISNNPNSKGHSERPGSKQYQNSNQIKSRPPSHHNPNPNANHKNYYPQPYQNPYLKNQAPAEMYGQNRGNRQVVIEKINYQNYLHRKLIEPPKQNFHYNNQPYYNNKINVVGGNNNKLYNAMGVGQKIVRGGPKIVNHKK